MIALLLLTNPAGGQVQFQPIQNPEDALPEPLPEVSDAEFHLPVDERTAAEIDRLIHQLGAPDHKAREAAGRELLTIGATAFARLRTAYHQADDLEVRLRIEQIVYDAYFTNSMFGQMGFLGIQKARDNPDHLHDPRIPVGHYGIRLSGVIASTGAARAGLQRDDIIIAFDGKMLSGSPDRAFQDFARDIRARGAGGQVTLSVVRTEQAFDVDVTLGPMPKENLRGVPDGPELAIQAEQRFHLWWSRYFLDKNSAK